MSLGVVRVNVCADRDTVRVERGFGITSVTKPKTGV
jgi:hypothetical protein